MMAKEGRKLSSRKMSLQKSAPTTNSGVCKVKKRISKCSVTKDRLGDSRFELSNLDGNGGFQSKNQPDSGKLDQTVQRLATNNIYDPFERLGDDEVGIIISFLPTCTTETLRRVSKLWKFKSESHNGNEASRRHFSHERTGDWASKEEANVKFRRRCRFLTPKDRLFY